MGNSGSGHQQQVTLVEGPPHSWAHSFPRSASFKVLPDRVPGQRLRLTDNGAILHNGGTISGRKAYYEAPIKSYRHNDFQNGDDYRKSLYGSEPDLRYPRGGGKGHGRQQQHSQPYYNNNKDNSVKARIGRSRKKYKAPPAPNTHNADSSSPDSFHQWETSAESSDVTTPSRRSRLFKTRAETKRPSVDNAVPMANSVKYQPLSFAHTNKPGAVPGQLQRSLSSPQFQDELTAKLRERAIREPPVGRAADSPHSSPVLRGRSKETAPSRMPRSQAAVKSSTPNGVVANARRPAPKSYINAEVKLPNVRNESKSTTTANGKPSNAYRNREASHEANNKRNENRENSRGNGKLSPNNVSDSRSPTNNDCETENNLTKNIEKATTPMKKFYFGMEAESQQDRLLNENDVNEVVDKFAATLRTSAPVLSNTSPSESFSSEPTNDDSCVGISLKLRPTLPRKQLDIPRFSPTAAWRLLSALESPVHSEEDDLVLMEEQIPHPHAGHQMTDKSGDSGISGDASPQHQDSTRNSQVAWTPQQDLEETSSDGGLESAPVSSESLGTAKFSPRFSLSLPRDERLPNYSYSDKLDVNPSSSFQNLKKLKRSVSGALGRNRDVAVSSLDENWLLSRSVPNLLNNSYPNRWSNSSPSSGDQGEEPGSLSKPSSFSYLANGGHIMYLPEYKTTKQQLRDKNVSNLNHISKSYEDLSRNQNNNDETDAQVMSSSTTGGRSKNRKFTFQSTIRQIERRRIADKLSKEAEEKEKRRLRELEAMKKVEEEFQRKREREKADIRHQLRLYNLTEGNREQPDGAVMPPPAPSTQVLSEFRQPRRDYRDYTPIRLDVDSGSHLEARVKKETVHPEVVYKIPKNTQVYVLNPHQTSGGGSNNHHARVDSPKSLASDNYRKDFAQGALPRSVASSDSELSQPNTRPTSRTKQRSRSPSPVAVNSSENDNSNEESDGTDEALPDLDLNCEGDSSNIENLAKVFCNDTLIKNTITLQPFNRNKTYKPVSFKPFGDKIAQITS